MKRVVTTAAAVVASLALAAPALAANDPSPGGAHTPTSGGMGPYMPGVTQYWNAQGYGGQGKAWHELFQPYTTNSLGQQIQATHSNWLPAYCGAAVADPLVGG